MRIGRAVRVVLVALSPMLAGAPLAAQPAAASALSPSGHRAPFSSCSLIAPAPVAAPAAVGEACPGVRPGAAVVSSVGVCTFNFMWRGSDGRTYMGTAGHCIIPEDAAPSVQTWSAGTGPPAFDRTGGRVGEFAYGALGPDDDFALVRLDPGPALTASAQMCHFGGPTGTSTEALAALTPLYQFGQGNLYASLLPGRTDVAVDPLSDPVSVGALGLVAPGDSGSPVVTTDGRAVGFVIAGSSLLGLPPLAGELVIARLGPQIAAAAAATGTTYRLQTAPVL